MLFDGTVQVNIANPAGGEPEEICARPGRPCPRFHQALPATAVQW